MLIVQSTVYSQLIWFVLMCLCFRSVERRESDDQKVHVQGNVMSSKGETEADSGTVSPNLSAVKNEPVCKVLFII